MPESAIEPTTIELKRVRATDDGVKLDLLIHWDIVQDEIPDNGGTHIRYSYKECKLFSVPYEGQKLAIGEFLTNREQEFLLKAKAKYEDDLSVEEKSRLEDLQQSIIYGRINDIDTKRPDKRYVQVQKTIDGQTLQRWCYVTYSVLLAYQNASLAIGDYVIVEFVDNDLGKPIAVDKVIGF